MSQVIFKDICKYFGNFTAVENFSLDICDGEFIVLVGPSGCGKTTTLRMLAGLEEASKGEIRIGDRVVNHVPPKDRNIAMVFQNYALYPHMTVYENMAFGLRIRHYPQEEIEKQVREAGKILGIENLLDRKPKALSGGQRQRVAMGRAIVRKPEVFLFDEPLSNLDAKLRIQMRIELKMLQKRLATTTVYVTHDQVEAMTLADRIAIMEKGILKQVGTPEEVFERPENTFVAGFIGTPTMNFLEGEITDENGAEVIDTGVFRLSISEEIKSKIASRNISKLTLGIRPHHIQICNGEKPSSPAGIFSRGNVIVIENMGSEKYVHISAKGKSMIICADGSFPVKEGDTINVNVDLSKIHIFDGKGDRIE